MAVRPIIRFPHPCLRTPTRKVTQFDADLRTLADDLLETMRAAPAVGITAPHIGIPCRIALVDLSGGRDVRIHVNPTILWSSAETARHEEGSISMPGVTDIVERPARVRVAFADLDGTAHVVEADEFLAACLQHEIDQLDGLFWLRRLSPLKRERLVKRFAKLPRGS